MTNPMDNWTPERIREHMRGQGVNWTPPSVESTWQEPTAADSAEEWPVWDPDTHDLRVLTPEELFDFTEKVKRSEEQMSPGPENWAQIRPDSTQEILQDIRDHAEDVFPRDHPPTERETQALVGAMKDHGVPAEQRALAQWTRQMEQNNPRHAAMLRHPSAQSLRP